jgi:hypothetical protein
LNPRNGQSLDMTPLVKGCSAICAQPRHSVVELARVHVDERALFFAQVRCSGSSLRRIPRSAAGPPRGYSLARPSSH